MASEVKYLDLLLRKSQVVRGTAARDILSLKSQESQGRAWGKRNGYTIRRVFRENLSAYKAGVKRPEFDEAVQAKAVDRDAGKWLGTPPDGLKVTKKAS